MTTDNIDLPLSASQRHFGEKQITLAADRWGVTPLQAAKIMMDIAYIKDAWNWVNMDTFLDNYTGLNGKTYDHHPLCNGSRKHPVGTKGVGCSCLNQLRQNNKDNHE